MSNAAVATGGNASVRFRLAGMMFLEYFVWGAWAVEMGGYMSSVLHFSGSQIGWVYSSTAIAAMVSPLLMGYVADRLMATEKLLAILHLVGAVLLAAAAFSGKLAASLGSGGEQFPVLLAVMIAYSLVYMPTLALTNSISFSNMVDPEKEFPLVRVFGTLGWIAAGLVVGLVLKLEPGSWTHGMLTAVFPPDHAFFSNNNFLVLAAVASAVLGLYCLALPHTPPKPAEVHQSTDRRQSVLSLLADRSFLVFVLCSFSICIPLAFYYNMANIFLSEVDAPHPTALQTIGQASEVIFMALMPVFIKALGVRRMLALGMLAWVLRYACFASLGFPLIVLALLLHGICYDFFFVASQIYVDSKADLSQRASAQSFIAFVTLGVGMFVGAQAAGWVHDHYPPAVRVEGGGRAVGMLSDPAELPLPEWDPVAKTGIARHLNLAPGQSITLADVTRDYIEQPGGPTYSAAALRKAMEQIDTNHDGRISREEWRTAQRHDWFWIWIWPAAWAAVTLLIFLIGFRDSPKTLAASH
ncbi:MAG TPA: MFS transporter [Pirellulales bacterium]|jgi:nucleoside transporter|nr:MFS transporter [Pirellulales bacterium]